ncbi:MAG: energy-coupling factor ABC transporter substrate-binding protein [Bacillota bacterium]
MKKWVHLLPIRYATKGEPSPVANLLLILVLVLLVIAPLLLSPDAPYEGADGKAEEIIMEINPAYEPWWEPIWEPPSGEIESMLFSLQAAAGSLFIGFSLGRISAHRKNSDRQS